MIYVIQRRSTAPSGKWFDFGKSDVPARPGQDEESFIYLEGDYLYEAFRTISRDEDGTETVLAVSSRAEGLD